MPKKNTEFDLETQHRFANFSQIVGIAEKLMKTLAKRAEQVENNFK